MEVPTAAPGSCRLPCQARSPRCPLGVPAAGGGHAWPAALAATPPSGSAEAHFVRRFLHPAPSPRRGGRSARGQLLIAARGTAGPGGHQPTVPGWDPTRGHGMATPCSRAGHPTKCWGDRTGWDMPLAPLWRFHLLLQLTPGSVVSKPGHFPWKTPLASLLDQPHTRDWPHLASLAGTFPRHQRQGGWGHGCALCDSMP